MRDVSGEEAFIRPVIGDDCVVEGENGCRVRVDHNAGTRSGAVVASNGGIHDRHGAVARKDRAARVAAISAVFATDASRDEVIGESAVVHSDVTAVVENRST